MRPSNCGMYFEEFEIGQKIVSLRRTITEADIVGFAGLSGDYNQLHTDSEFSKNTPFGQRVAHGLLVLSIASGLAMRTGALEGTTLAFREITEWKFIRPVMPGDTVHVVIEIKKLKALPRSKAGTVAFELDVRNQRDETAMKGLWAMLVASKAAKAS